MKIDQTEKKRWLEVLLLAFFFSVMSVQYLPRFFHEAAGILFGAAAAPAPLSSGRAFPRWRNTRRKRASP
ncbi:hypothetical protein [Selenomonas sp. TAMA-11512]|uniref:hypothetical protein n=1 Tax=Selenomonas sp. TAMA-11512 TaxID=3095337 RepID=UPI0030D3BE75